MRIFTRLAALIFTLVAILHALRLCFRWEVTLNGIVIPLWPSAIGLIVPAFLAVMLWRESRGGTP